MCCNGALFSYVPITATDDLALGPADRVDLENGQTGLKQSCLYYRKRLCSIYAHGRPQSCSDFRCGVLRAYSRNEISLEDAFEEIRTTIRRLEQIKARMQARTGAPARNLVELFKAWTASQGGCYADWSPDHSTILREYYDLLSHLRCTFGESADVIT